MMDQKETRISNIKDFLSSAFSSYMIQANSGAIEGDISGDVRRNIEAYAVSLASPIAEVLEGGVDSEGTPVGAFLKKTGDQMTGGLSALFGFDCGFNGNKVLSVNKDKTELVGPLWITNGGIVMGDKNIISSLDNTLYINQDSLMDRVDFGESDLTNLRSISTINGVLINKDQFTYQNNTILHSGNACLSTVDWVMHNADIHGSASVIGDCVIGGALTAGGGFVLSKDQHKYIESTSADISVYKNINLNNSNIQYNSQRVLWVDGDKLCVGGRDISFGIDSQKISLSADLYNINGDIQLIDTNGYGSFINGFSAGHGRDVLINTITNGVVFVKNIHIGNETNTISCIDNYVSIAVGDGGVKIGHSSPNDVLVLSTHNSLFSFDKPIQARDHVSIYSSKTRLEDMRLFFSDNIYLHQTLDGIKHFGNSYFSGDVGTDLFASGFSGYGWGVREDVGNGSIVATFDELVVRKKMRIYELEVQKITATNGSLWVSDSCSGDQITKL
ncbi:MAG: hypothetical protein ACRDD8_05990 [Bacteroidales bacterium]